MFKRLARPQRFGSAFAATTLTAGVLALAGAAPATADTTISSNWAGYAAHRSGVSFNRVSSSWKQPSAHCKSGERTYSAVWVGLGGYSLTSQALEQTGTEVDCNASGKIKSSAWYELVPAPSKPIHLTVHPGDSIDASVAVGGHEVTVSLSDRTTGHSFHKTFHASTIDLSSAEWIVEAPSECTSPSQCQTLPLANFGSATFTGAQATSTASHTGAISDPAWNTTKIKLSPGGRQFITYVPGKAGAASPSPLTAGGSSFSVKYSTVKVPTSSFDSARASAIRDGYLVHPGR